jgi:hypothetical protein
LHNAHFICSEHCEMIRYNGEKRIILRGEIEAISVMPALSSRKMGAHERARRGRHFTDSEHAAHVVMTLASAASLGIRASQHYFLREKVHLPSCEAPGVVGHSVGSRLAELDAGRAVVAGRSASQKCAQFSCALVERFIPSSC